MKIVNIYNQYREIKLFCRDEAGILDIQTVKDFFPYFYEKSLDGTFKSYKGDSLRKMYVSVPSDVPKQRSKEAFEADILFVKRYLIDKVTTIDKCPIKFAFIDIEVQSDELPNVQLAEQPVSCITVYNSFTKEYKSFYLPNYSSEFMLLEDFVKYMKEEKFDLWLSWYVGFDYNYLYNRCPDFAKKISPIGKSRYGDGEVYYPAGISIVDYLGWFKKVTLNKEKQYTLDYIAEKHLGKRKEYAKVDFSKVSEEIKRHNKEDVKIMVELEEKFKLIPYYDEVRRLAKVEWEDLIWNSRTIDMLLLQEAKKQKVVLPMKPKDNEKEDYLGAFREAFETGAFTDGICEYDLSSAYPYAIINFCLDPANIGNDTTKYRSDVQSINVNGAEFIQNPNALLPTVVKRMIILKNNISKELKNFPLDSPEYKDTKTKYNAIKSIVNSCYGVMGNRFFRLYNKDVASATTFIVRDLLHYVKDNIEAKGYKVIYVDTDSVPKDTPIIINENDNIKIIPIEDLFISPKTNTRSKYDISKKDYQILTEKGWSKVKYIYRHKTRKTMYRILTRKGFIEISQDHSLVINNKSVTPNQLKIGDEIDLISSPINNNLKCDKELAWLVGFWLAEGSCGYYKKIKKISWHLDNQNISFLKKSQKILSRFGFSTKIIDCRKSSSTYRLVPDGNNKELYSLFNLWCLTKTGDKKIPYFILNANLKSKKSFLDGYWNGDGNIGKKDKIKSIDSIDKCLVAGTCHILIALNKDYSLSIRDDKPNVIRVRIIRNKKDKRIKQSNKIQKIIKYKNYDNIYDIETENHHFCGGIGNILLHNSVFIKSRENLTSFLNELIQKWGKEKYDKEQIDIDFEYKGIYEKLLILAKCRYIGYLTTNKGIEEKIKGVEAKRKDSTEFMKKFQRTLIDKILDKEPKKKIMTWIKGQVKKVKKAPIADIAFPCKLGRKPEEYKNVPIFLRALNLTDGFTKKVGNAFYYIYMKPFGHEEVIKEVFFFEGKKLTSSMLKNEWKLKYKEDVLVKNMDINKKRDLIDNLIIDGKIKMDKIKTTGKIKNVMAFDSEEFKHINRDDICWDTMVRRNIWMKLDTIFKSMNWEKDLQEIINETKI